MRYKWKTRKQRGGNTVSIYKSLLSSFVYSDAKHDFKKNNFYDKHKSSIENSIPKASYTEYTEDGILNSVKITHINDIPNSGSLTMNGLIEEHHTNSITELDLLIDNKIKRRYDVKVIYYQKGEKVVTNPEHFTHYFEGLRTFVIDSFNLKFFDGFKNTNDTSYYNLENTFYVLYNREMENDPGNKGRLGEKHFAHKGFRLQDVYDDDNIDIVYNKWNDSQLIHKNMFYSNYNLTLTNSFDRNIIKNNVILKMDDEIYREEFKNVKILNNIDNLIESCNNREIEPYIAFTRKRCGDSLQVLSLFDSKRKLYSSNEYDISSRIHNNPKMIISLDRLLLYYSLLMGVDIGFTVKRGNNRTTNDYYLIIFNNRNSEVVSNEPVYNYSKNKLKGGRNTQIKLKNRIKLNRTRRVRKMDVIQEEYKQIILPEVEQYLLRDELISGFLHYTIRPIKYINESSENRQNIIEYILFKNNIEYTIEYISKIIYEEYIRMLGSYTTILHMFTTVVQDKLYSSKLSSITNILTFYKHYEYYEIIGKLLSYYDIHNKQLADNIRSLNCLLWIIQSYFDMEEDNTFNSCNVYILKDLMTPKLQKIYDEQTVPNYILQEGETEDTYLENFKKTVKEHIETNRLRHLSYIIKEKVIYYSEKNDSETEEMRAIYEQICFTASWNFVDLSRIISYIVKHDLDVYDTLIKLGGDYYNGMYVDNPNRAGIQSTSIMVLTQHNYDVDSKRERTPEIQAMLDEIYAMECNGYIFEYKKAFDELLKLFKRTFDKHLLWGLEIV